MLRSFISAGLAALLLSAPQAAIAQEEAPAEAPKKVRSFPPVNFDQEQGREDIWVLDLSNGERVLIRLMPQWAPNHVARIKQLTSQGFYDGVIFHRVIEGFMAQGGDPTGTGQGGSALPDLEVFYPRFSLDKRYTNFGRVIGNMAAVDAINRGEPPTNPTRIVQASMASDNRPVPSTQPAPRIENEITLDDLSAPIGQ